MEPTEHAGHALEDKHILKLPHLGNVPGPKRSKSHELRATKSEPAGRTEHRLSFDLLFN